MQAGASQPVGFRWLRTAGGAPPSHLSRSAKPLSGRSLSWLLLGFGVVLGPSRDQAGNEGAEQGFAAPASVVHKLEEAEIKRQLVLRDAAVRA